MSEVSSARGQQPLLDQVIEDLGREFLKLDKLEYGARRVVEKMALAIQASTLIHSADPMVAEAFCVSRLAPESRGQLYGTLPAAINCQALIARATPC